VELRPTAAEDLPALFEVFCSAIGELYRRHNLDPPGPSLEVFQLQHRHVLEHDGDRCRVAVDDGRLVAYAAAIARGDSWFLCSLFVRPDAQGRGVGTALLDSVWGDGYAQRRTLTDAIQPVSNGLYSRRGLVPATPALHLGGRPTASPDRALEAAEPDPEALRALDLAGYGFDRAVDHAYWARHGRRTLWLRRGEPTAYTYVSSGGRIGPLAGATPDDAAAALTSELARLDEASLVVPGSSAAVVAAATACGLRFVRVPGLLLLSAGTPAPRSLAISSYTLL
jgi:GNAT superfamily N-acetyltransferase